jgi:signal transduction histidine kinase
MSEPVWYRSFYWRIAIGFIACVAVLLIAQAALFVWMADQTGMPLLARSPEHLSTVIASDLSAALETDPKLDIQQYIRARVGNRSPQVVVVMKDGRVMHSATTDPPEWAVRAARFRLMRGWPSVFPPAGSFQSRPERPQGPVRQPGIDRQPNFERQGPAPGLAPGPEPPDGPRAEGPRLGGRDARIWPPNRPRPDGAGPPRGVLTGPIVLNGATVGLVVIVPTGVPPFVTLREFGPSLAAAGAVLLLVGSATMAFFVFRPARRRLRALEEAAEQIGAGDTSVRAPERGGDEVTALAKAFNRMAADLDARVRELQEVDRARRQLLADVSHELMTPLTAIRGYLETLAFPAAVKDEETRERYLQIVTDETMRLEAIIGDLLDLARLEGGGAQLQRDIVAVDALFARAAERHAPALAERTVTLETRVEEGADEVEGDGRRLEQVVQNLVANAVRHTPKGGRIELSAAAVNGHVRLRVRDSGPGIPAEHLSRVFDRFYRVDAARDQASGGSGLGLSIVRAIVDAHGGTVTAGSAPGGGAMFDITLDRPGA